MFCSNCGKKISDTAIFCPHCGKKVRQQENRTLTPIEEKQSIWDRLSESAEKSRGFVIVCACITFMLIVFSLYCLFFNKSYEKPIKELEKAMENNDTEALLKLFPDRIISAISQKIGYGEDVIENEIINYFEYQIDSNGGVLNLKYNIESVRSDSQDDLQYINEQLSTYLGNTLKIDDSKYLVVEWDVRVNGDYVDNVTSSHHVIKMDGKWYLSPDFLE